MHISTSQYALHYSYFGNKNCLLVSVSSSFSVSLFQWDSWQGKVLLKVTICDRLASFYISKIHLHFFTKWCAPGPFFLKVNFAVLVFFQTLHIIAVFDCYDLEFFLWREI